MEIEDTPFREAVEMFRAAHRTAAFTGAGISVESGIPDFRSPGGLWSVYDPQEYATIEAFRSNPSRSWELHREIGKMIDSAEPNPAHFALADLETAGRLEYVITQNIDGLHQEAGSKNVLEIHGDHRRLQCLECGVLEKLKSEVLEGEGVPLCPACSFPMKPNVVLFGESVRHMDEIIAALGQCDLLLVIGTSVQVYPAASLPALVHTRGGLIYEFNVEETPLTLGDSDSPSSFPFSDPEESIARSDFFFPGPASITLPAFVSAVLQT